MIFIIALCIVGLVSIAIGLANRAQFYFAPILGFMVGGLYSFTDYDDGREHTLQVCLLFLSITIVWIEPNGLAS